MTTPHKSGTPDWRGKVCECGRPAVKRTAGNFVCAVCLDIQTRSAKEDRTQRIRALSKIHEPGRQQSVVEEYRVSNWAIR